MGSSFAFLNFDLPVTFWGHSRRRTRTLLCCLKNVDLCHLVRNRLKHCVLEQETFFPVVCSTYLSYGRISEQGNRFLLLFIIERAASVIGVTEPFISFHVYHLCTGPDSGTWTSASHFVNQRSKFLTLFWISLYVYLKISQSSNCQLNRQCGKSFLKSARAAVLWGMFPPLPPKVDRAFSSWTRPFCSDIL